jgi:hypothetical protein
VAGPDWADDHPADAARIGANCGLLLTDLAAAAAQRALPTLADACQWHRRIYDGCAVPAAGYVGNFRGDPAHPELADYEVGIGAMLPDGLPEKVGVWAADVAGALAGFIAGVHAALGVVDPAIPVGSRPSTVDELREVVTLTAEVHGEWARVHPFANGNGRIARVWAAVLALRYGLPVFVTLKPRPGDIAYARAATRSMGRPPDFDGDHGEAVAVFAHLLTLSLLA